MLDRNKYNEVGGGDTSAMWPAKGVELNVGDSIEGVYVEKKVVKANNKDTNIYILESKGVPVGVWGSAVLDSKFAQIPLNTAVGIEYLGRKKGNQPQPFKDFYVATENGEVGKPELPY